MRMRSPAVWIAAAYTVAGSAWVVVGDVLVGSGGEGQTLKGLAFVGLSAAFIAGLVRASWERQVAATGAARKAEDDLRSLVANLPGIVYRRRFDAGWTAELLSESCADVTGYRSAELLAGGALPLRELVLPEDRARAEAEMRRAAESGRSYDIAYRIRTKAGEVRWLADRGRAVERGPAGEPLVAEGFATDVTLERRLAEQLAQSHKLEAIGRLAGGIAHDFNNMLTAILGFGRLLHRKLPADDPRRGDVDEIVQAGERAATLVRQILLVSRETPTRRQPVDLRLLVGALEKLLRRVVEEDVQVVTRLAPGAVVVEGDAGKLEQVILNLVVNARDAMPGGGVIEIEVEPEEVVEGALACPPGAFGRLTVIDHGTGITEAVRERIFEPFFTTKAADGGTGLGLSTVFAIVREHGGDIRVDTEVGRGAAFHVFLPICALPAGAEPAAPRDASAIVRGSGHLLVAEDEDRVRRLVRAVLTGSGFRVSEAARGADALERARASGAELAVAIVDLILPDMNGRELARRLRAAAPQVRILYISGYDEARISESARLEPGAAFLAKPFTPTELSDKLHDLLEAPEPASAASAASA